jgi:hypothetical protein
MSKLRGGAAMPKLHSQLALFGAIDEEVTNAKKALRDGAAGADAETACATIDLVEKFLPGTAGFGQSEWYRELRRFLSGPALRARRSSRAPDFPELSRAISDLSEVENERHDRDPVLARATYAAVILAKIYRLTRIRQDDEDAILAILPTTLKSWTQADAPIPEDALRREINDIVDRRTWLRKAGVEVSQEFAERALPCFGALKKVQGRYCAFITTETTDDELSVADVAKIVEPINWDDLLKSFFCKMTNQATPFDTSNGASRVSERISGECDKYHLDTALVFWKVKQLDGSIYMNYDLDSQRDLDMKLVDVDSGYISVTPMTPGQNHGVRIRTSKLERVQGLSPTATAALACLMGWGTFANEMLAGKAREFMNVPVPPPPIMPFKRSPNDKLAYTDPVA